MDQIQVGEYEHYKGKRYRVLGIAKHSETLEDLVLYQALYGNCDFWVRPARIFEDEVRQQGQRAKRFKFISS